MIEVLSLKHVDVQAKVSECATGDPLLVALMVAVGLVALMLELPPPLPESVAGALKLSPPAGLNVPPVEVPVMALMLADAWPLPSSTRLKPALRLVTICRS